jgi:hypothetical protein
MKISEDLKNSLIADVENMIGLKLSDEAKAQLERCFEITIGTHLSELNQAEVSVAKRKVCVLWDNVNKCVLYPSGCDDCPDYRTQT